MKRDQAKIVCHEPLLHDVLALSSVHWTATIMMMMMMLMMINTACAS
jgi:hypothetical protein